MGSRTRDGCASGAPSRNGYVKCVSSGFIAAFKRVAQGVVIVMLVIIPVPVGRLFARLFDQKPRATAALVVRREDDAEVDPHPDPLPKSGEGEA